MHFSTTFGQIETGLFDPAIFHCISVIHPVQLWREYPFLPIEECSPDIIESVFKALADKNVMSFELSTRMAPGLKGLFKSFVWLFRKRIYNFLLSLQFNLFHISYCVKQYNWGIHKFSGENDS